MAENEKQNIKNDPAYAEKAALAVKTVTAVIPSYKPDEKLMKVICGLEEAGFDDIIVIDDGSGPEFAGRFPDPGAHPAVTLLRHEVNRGKGAALKTAFEFFIKERSGRAGVVTADGDAQHRTEDIVACSVRMLEEKDKLVLGVRDFSLPHVPKRSRMGNRITSGVFRVACGLRISDTQTGLRAIPSAMLPDMCRVDGSRYEYETNMLLAMSKLGITHCEQVIETVYIEENQTSHFRPFRDSVRIYSLILKFCASSIISALVDILAFYLLQKFLGPLLPDISGAFRTDVIVCTVIARIISAAVNFTLNRKAVFRSDESLGRSLAKYVALAIPVMLISGGTVSLFRKLLGASYPSVVTLIKIVVDAVLYVINFRIQHLWVCVKKKKGGADVAR